MKSVLKLLPPYILYIVFLTICYEQYICKVYAYNGFGNNPDDVSMAVSTILLCVSFVFIAMQKIKSYSSLVVMILFLVNYVPSVILFKYNPLDLRFIILLSIFWLILIIANNAINAFKSKKAYNKKEDNNDKKAKDKELGFSNRKNNKTLMSVAITLLNLLSVLVIIIFFTGINLGFNDVYELRSNFLETKMPSIMLYIFSAMKVINPLFFVYFYKNNKYFWCVITVLIQLLAFLCDGSKSTLFSLLIVVILATRLKKNDIKNKYVLNDKVKGYLLWGLAAINFAGFIEFKLFHSAFIYNYFVRRLFFVPARLHEKYYLFFSENPPDYFRQSILRRIGIESPYERSIQTMIGAKYFNDSSLIANNGLFSDALMNFGKFGVVIMPVLLAFAFSFLDVCAANAEIIYLITPIISTSYVFLSSSFFTALATHGYIVMCLIIKMLSSKVTYGED